MPEFEKREDLPRDPNTFDPEDEEIEEALELRATFVKALTQNGFPDTLVLERERAADVFHERRLEILDYLQTHEPASVRALANALEYDKGVVSRDLQKLGRIDVVEFEDSGRAKAPRLKHRHVVVEPIV